MTRHRTLLRTWRDHPIPGRGPGTPTLGVAKRREVYAKSVAGVKAATRSLLGRDCPKERVLGRFRGRELRQKALQAGKAASCKRLCSKLV